MKTILHKLTYAQNPSQYEAHPSYYEEILCKVLTVYARVTVVKTILESTIFVLNQPYFMAVPA